MIACPRCTRFSSGGSSPKLRGKVGDVGEVARGTGGQVVLLWSGPETHCSLRRSLRTPGPSRAGSSEMRMASSMAASSPEPPSPRRAGPKHSGLRISSRTTTLAFSSTLSPGGVGRVRGFVSHHPGVLPGQPRTQNLKGSHHAPVCLQNLPPAQACGSRSGSHPREALAGDRNRPTHHRHHLPHR